MPSVQNHFIPRWHFCGLLQNPSRAAHCQTQVCSPWPWTLTGPLPDLAVGSFLSFISPPATHFLPHPPYFSHQIPKILSESAGASYSPGNLCWILNTLLITLPSAPFFALKYCLCLLLFLSYSFLKGKSVLYVFIMSPRNSHSSWHMENLRSVLNVRNVLTHTTFKCTKLILSGTMGKANLIRWKVRRVRVQSGKWVLPFSDSQWPSRKVPSALVSLLATMEHGFFTLKFYCGVGEGQFSLYPSWVLRCGLNKNWKRQINKRKDSNSICVHRGLIKMEPKTWPRQCLYFLNKETIHLWEIDLTKRFSFGVLVSEAFRQSVTYTPFFSPEFFISGNKDVSLLVQGGSSHVGDLLSAFRVTRRVRVPFCTAASQVALIRNSYYALWHIWGQPALDPISKAM